MSRKDPRRAIAIALSPAVMARLRARQARTRGRRLMDTLRMVLADALAAPAPVLTPGPPAPPGTPVRLLQLPARLRRALNAVCHETGLSQQEAITALVMGDATGSTAIRAGAETSHETGTACSPRAGTLEYRQTKG